MHELASAGWVMLWALTASACWGKSVAEANLVELNDAGAAPIIDAAAVPPGLPLPGIAVDENVAAGDPVRTDVLALGVFELLDAHCGGCHSNRVSQGGLGDVLDIQKLIELGLIVPGSSATSPLLARIRDGSMPPPEDGSRRTMIDSEIALLARFIDELEAPVVQACAALDFVSPDEVYAALAADIALQPAAERPFIRYVGLTYASNAGLCGPALERQRLALFKLVNSVSTAPDIRVPEAIDASQLLYRLDLRHYGWDRPIDLEDDGTADFTDGWLAIAAEVGPYATEHEGPDADSVKLETSVPVPFLPANAVVHAATTGDLYYALIGVRGNIYETQLALGIDLEVAFEDNEARRAGFYDSAPERETIVIRLQQGISTDRYYWLLEEQRTDDSTSILDGYLDIEGNGEQTIFHLPNGLQAYSVAAQNGDRLGSLPLGCVLEDCYRPERANAGSCHGCHNAGLIPVTDVVRGYVEANQVRYDEQSFADILIQYPEPSELSQLMDADSEIHRSALERAGVPRGAPDPISRVFMQFELDTLDLARAAAELGVTPEAFRSSLAGLGPRLVALGAPDGRIDRSAFGDAFSDAQCVLHGEARNRRAGCQ